MVLRIGVAVMALGVALQLGVYSLWGVMPRKPQRGWSRQAFTAWVISTAVIFLGSTIYGFALAFR